MSKALAGRAGLVAGIIAALAGVTRHAAAQVTVAEQTTRVAALERMANAAEAVAESTLRARAAHIPMDTIRVGPLTVLTLPEDAVLVRAGTALAWRRLAPMFRGDSQLLTREWYFLRLQHVGGGGYTVGRITGPIRASTVGFGAQAPGVAQHLATNVAAGLTDGVGHPFWDWIGGALPLTDDSATLRRVYVDLVTAPSKAVHQCYGGDLGACSLALELDTVPDPATAWYGPGERELVVRASRAYANDGSASDLARHGGLSRCLVDHDDFSCVAYLHALPAHQIRLPLGQVARASAARTALALGGPGAYTRLIATRGSPGQRLAAAARLPLDTVVAAWRAEVLAAKPPAERVSVATQWTTIFWVLVLGTLALRSAPWRSA